MYINPELNIINPSSEVLELGVYMYSNWTFDFHVTYLYKRCSNLRGWILRTFNTRETRTMVTLFNSIYRLKFLFCNLYKSLQLVYTISCSLMNRAINTLNFYHQATRSKVKTIIVHTFFNMNK